MRKTIKSVEVNLVQFFGGSAETEARVNVRFDTDLEGITKQSVGFSVTVTPDLTAAISDAVDQCKVKLAEGGWEVDEAT
jgi:hypothetical protein